MKINKFIGIGLVAAITSMTIPNLATAASSEDFTQNQGACMVSFNDASTTRVINVGYIQLIEVANKEPKALHISMASNYYNNTTQLTIQYKSGEAATEALMELSDRINNCQYDAVKKRNKKM